MTSHQEQTLKQEQLLPTTIEFIFTYCSVNVPFSIAMKSQFLSDMVEDIGIQCIKDGKLNIIYDSYEFTKEELELYFYLVETYYTSGYNVLANTILENNISPQHHLYNKYKHYTNISNKNINNYYLLIFLLKSPIP